jgi:hypothetical protein
MRTIKKETDGMNSLLLGDGPYLLWPGVWDNLQLSEKTVQQGDGGEGGGHSLGTYYKRQRKTLGLMNHHM